MPKSLLDVPCDPRGTILLFADGPSRHALRATCTAMYRLPAVGEIRVPVQNGAAMGLCQKRALAVGAGRMRVPFWGSTATRLTMRASSSRLKLLAPVRDAFTALQRVMGACPATVELRLHDCAHREFQAVLEWLAHEPLWSEARLRLVRTTDYRMTDMPRLSLVCRSDALRKRLAWCDAEISRTSHSGPYVALENLCVTGNRGCLVHRLSEADCARLFPAVQHVAVSMYGGGMTSVETAASLSPLAGQLRSLWWSGDIGPTPRAPVLRLPDAASITPTSTEAHLDLVSGGRLVDGRADDCSDFNSRTLGATGSLTVKIGPALAAYITGNQEAMPPLPCEEGVLLLAYQAGPPARPVQEAALVLVRRMRSMRTLTISGQLVTQPLVGALPASLREVVVVSDTLKAVRLLLTLPGLSSISLPFALTDQAPTRIGASVRETRLELARRRPHVAVPIVHLPGLGYWDLEALGLPPEGVVPHRVRLSGQTLGLVPLPPERAAWTRGILALDLPFPLGPVFWARTAGLAEAFPEVTSICTRRPDEGIWSRDFDAVRDLCVALGPRLQRVDGLEFRDLERLQNERVVAACPWLDLV